MTLRALRSAAILALRCLAATVPRALVAALLLSLLTLLAAPAPAHAHVAGYTDTSVQIATGGVRVIYTVPQDSLLELGGAAPGSAAGTAVGPPEQYLDAVRAGWSLQSAGQRCLLVQAGARALTGVASYQFQFTYACPGGLDPLELGYGLFFARWPEHENFVRVFLADQRLRVRFTSDKQQLAVPAAALLAQWGKPLAPGFFDSDPHHTLRLDGADAAALPRVAAARPSLGSLRLDQLDPGFIQLGVMHIFGGADHVLFVVGLVLLTRGWRRLLLLVSAFTLAHSVTMALSALELIRFDPALTEPLIAATIVYIGIENLWALRRGVSAVQPGGAAAAAVQNGSVLSPAMLRRTALVFAFGLVHGVGFSYVLREMGLREDLLGALLYFNLGVELGQLAIIAAVLPLVLVLGRLAWGRKAAAGLSAAVGLAGAAMIAGRI